VFGHSRKYTQTGLNWAIDCELPQEVKKNFKDTLRCMYSDVLMRVFHHWASGRRSTDGPIDRRGDTRGRGVLVSLAVSISHFRKERCGQQ